MAVSTILILFSLFSFFSPYFLSLLLSNGTLKINGFQSLEVPASSAKWCAAHFRDYLLQSFIDVKNWHGSEKSSGHLLSPASQGAKNILRFSKQHLRIITPAFQFGTLRLDDSKLSLPLTLSTTHSLLRPQIAFGRLLTSSMSIPNSLWAFNFLFLITFSTRLCTWQKFQKWYRKTSHLASA